MNTYVIVGSILTVVLIAGVIWWFIFKDRCTQNSEGVAIGECPANTKSNNCVAGNPCMCANRVCDKKTKLWARDDKDKYIYKGLNCATGYDYNQDQAKCVLSAQLF